MTLQQGAGTAGKGAPDRSAGTYVKRALLLCLISVLLSVFTVTSGGFAYDFALIAAIRSALLGSLSFALPFMAYALCSLWVPRNLSAGVVLYKALYAIVLKYLLLIFCFALSFKFGAVIPVLFILSFCMSLLVHFIGALLWHK